MGLALRRHARRGRGKAKADDQRHAGERQHHHLKVCKAVVGKHRKIVHDMRPQDVPVISRSEPAEGSWWGLIIAAVRHGRRSEPLGQTLIVVNLARHPTAGRLLHCGIAIGSMSALGQKRKNSI